MTVKLCIFTEHEKYLFFIMFSKKFLTFESARLGEDLLSNVDNLQNGFRQNWKILLLQF